MDIYLSLKLEAIFKCSNLVFTICNYTTLIGSIYLDIDTLPRLGVIFHLCIYLLFWMSWTNVYSYGRDVFNGKFVSEPAVSCREQKKPFRYGNLSWHGFSLVWMRRIMTDVTNEINDLQQNMFINESNFSSNC